MGTLLFGEGGRKASLVATQYILCHHSLGQIQPSS